MLKINFIYTTDKHQWVVSPPKTWQDKSLSPIKQKSKIRTPKNRMLSLNQRINQKQQLIH